MFIYEVMFSPKSQLYDVPDPLYFRKAENAIKESDSHKDSDYYDVHMKRIMLRD